MRTFVAFVLACWMVLANQNGNSMEVQSREGESPRPDEAIRVAAVLRHEDALNEAHDVELQGHLAYVAGSYFPKVSQGRLMAKEIVVDLSSPNSPHSVATVNFPDIRGPNGLTIAGNVWFLAGGQTVLALDIRDPLGPRLLASLTSKHAFPTADDNAHDLVYRDGYLYVTSQGDNALVALQIHDPEIVRITKEGPGGGTWHHRGPSDTASLEP